MTYERINWFEPNLMTSEERLTGKPKPDRDEPEDVRKSASVSLADRIIDAGRKRRGEIVDGVPLTGLAAKIVAAAKKARGEK